jgi:hypothetical protein
LSTGIAKAPNPKFQIAKKLQVPITKEDATRFFWELGAWDFFGAWDLGFGTFAPFLPC